MEGEWLGCVLGWQSGHCGCRNQDGSAVARDLGCLCGHLFPGPVCPRSSTKLWCGVDWVGLEFFLGWETEPIMLSPVVPSQE